ncbi:MAG: cytochrome C oxidase subunit IV family protein [Tunicatimonas sp.]
MAQLDENTAVQYEPVDRKKTNKLWRIAGIMAVLTIIEFVFAIFLPRGPLLYATFVIMTIVKAFYIVGEFMHLKGEVKTLIWSILIPSIFVVWLVIALIAEGSSVMELRF